MSRTKSQRDPAQGAGAPAHEDDRETVVPPFDVPRFAHESDSKIRTLRDSAAEGELTLVRIQALFDVGSYEDALRVAEAALVVVPLHAETLAWAAKCRDALERAWLSNVGPLSGVPSLAVSPRELRELGLDRPSGFVLAQIDGATSVETLLDLCGMPRAAVLRVLSDLAVRGIVTFR